MPVLKYTVKLTATLSEESVKVHIIWDMDEPIEDAEARAIKAAMMIKPRRLGKVTASIQTVEEVYLPTYYMQR